MKTTYAVLARIDADLDITSDSDPEVKAKWYPTCLYVGWLAAKDPAQTFVSATGRSKYINPIYISLVESGNQTTAETWNNENKDFYTPSAEKGVMDILNGGAPSVKRSKR